MSSNISWKMPRTKQARAVEKTGSVEIIWSKLKILGALLTIPLINPSVKAWVDRNSVVVPLFKYYWNSFSASSSTDSSSLEITCVSLGWLSFTHFANGGSSQLQSTSLHLHKVLQSEQQLYNGDTLSTGALSGCRRAFVKHPLLLQNS